MLKKSEMSTLLYLTFNKLHTFRTPRPLNRNIFFIMLRTRYVRNAKNVTNRYNSNKYEKIQEITLIWLRTRYVRNAKNVKNRYEFVKKIKDQQ